MLAYKFADRVKCCRMSHLAKQKGPLQRGERKLSQTWLFGSIVVVQLLFYQYYDSLEAMTQCPLLQGFRPLQNSSLADPWYLPNFPSSLLQKEVLQHSISWHVVTELLHGTSLGLSTLENYISVDPTCKELH